MKNYVYKLHLVSKFFLAKSSFYLCKYGGKYNKSNVLERYSRFDFCYTKIENKIRNFYGYDFHLNFNSCIDPSYIQFTAQEYADYNSQSKIKEFENFLSQILEVNISELQLTLSYIRCDKKLFRRIIYKINLIMPFKNAVSYRTFLKIVESWRKHR